MLGRIRTFALCFLVCLGCARDVAAHSYGPNARYILHVEDESGRELPTFHHGGQTFVLGHYGERYDVRVENRTGGRIEAVVTVDGRDVISGTVGDYVNARGYLINAYDDVRIEGFRQSWSEVAAFRFTSPRNSYSSRMGTPQNVGVIGVAIFPERERPAVVQRMPEPAPVPYAADERARDYAAPSASAPAHGEAESSGIGTGYGREARKSKSSDGALARPSAPAARRDNLGTEYGESVSSSVQQVDFERADRTHPTELIAMRYDDREGLIARGIAVDPPRYRPHPVCGPQPFPQNGGFAPPPPACSY
jgi:hypothetical protein